MKKISLSVCLWVCRGQKNIKNSRILKNREKSNGVENHVTHECQKIFAPPPGVKKTSKVLGAQKIEKRPMALRTTWPTEDKST